MVQGPVAFCNLEAPHSPVWLVHGWHDRLLPDLLQSVRYLECAVWVIWPRLHSCMLVNFSKSGGEAGRTGPTNAQIWQ